MNSCRIQLTSLLLAGLVTIGCSNPKELTRGKAKDILQNSPALQHSTDVLVFAEPNNATCLAKAGLIKQNINMVFDSPFSSEAEIGPSGRNVISKVEDFSDYALQSASRLRIWFKNPPKVIIDEITGITGAGEEKTVDYVSHFDWTNVGLNRAALSCMKAGGSRFRAVFRLYDDGWRIASL
jgi:hypothetical protein